MVMIYRTERLYQLSVIGCERKERFFPMGKRERGERETAYIGAGIVNQDMDL